MAFRFVFCLILAKASLDQVCDALDKAQERCRQMIESQMAFLQQRQTKKRSLVCAGADPTGALRVQVMYLPFERFQYSDTGHGFAAL